MSGRLHAGQTYARKRSWLAQIGRSNGSRQLHQNLYEPVRLDHHRVMAAGHLARPTRPDAGRGARQLAVFGLLSGLLPLWSANRPSFSRAVAGFHLHRAQPLHLWLDNTLLPRW